MASNILPSRDVIWSKIQKGDRLCALCGDVQESLAHLFLKCPVIRAIAFECKWGMHLEAWQCSTIENLISLCLKPPPKIFGRQLASEEITVILVAILEKSLEL